MSVLPFKPRTKPQPIVTRAMYAEQRYVETKEQLIAARQALELRVNEALADGADPSGEDIQIARDTMTAVDALLTADDIEWGTK